MTSYVEIKAIAGTDTTACLQKETLDLGRRGDPEEIAQAIVFLASDEGAFTVGSEFVIDGGMSNL
jgi:NAD(P)-dependent dehydrogenase (short-subunit alcohol dehydrogenase family)